MIFLLIFPLCCLGFSSLIYLLVVCWPFFVIFFSHSFFLVFLWEIATTSSFSSYIELKHFFFKSTGGASVVCSGLDHCLWHQHFIWIPVRVLGCSTSNPAPCQCTWKAVEDSTGTWVPTSYVHMWYPDGAPGSWFQPGLSIVVTWGLKQRMEGQPLSLSPPYLTPLFFCDSANQIHI